MSLEPSKKDEDMNIPCTQENRIGNIETELREMRKAQNDVRQAICGQYDGKPGVLEILRDQQAAAKLDREKLDTLHQVVLGDNGLKAQVIELRKDRERRRSIMRKIDVKGWAVLMALIASLLSWAKEWILAKLGIR